MAGDVILSSIKDVRLVKLDMVNFNPQSLALTSIKLVSPVGLGIPWWKQTPPTPGPEVNLNLMGNSDVVSVVSCGTGINPEKNISVRYYYQAFNIRKEYISHLGSHMITFSNKTKIPKS